MAEQMTLVEQLFDFSNLVYTELMVNLIFAAIIILIGVVIGRLSGKLVTRLLKEIELNLLVRKATNKRVQIEELAGKMTSYVIYFFVIIMAFNQLGLTMTIFYLISAAIIIVIIISFVLGVRDFIPNMFAGLTIQKKGFLQVGDKIEFRGVKGKVDYINLIEIRVLTKGGDIISIPNSLLAKHEMVKRSSIKQTPKKRSSQKRAKKKAKKD